MTISSLDIASREIVATMEVPAAFPSVAGKGIEYGHGHLCIDRNKRCKNLAASCGIDDWVIENCKMTCESKDCDKMIPKPTGACSNPLGLSFNGGRFKIPDSAFTASSYFKSNGWSARPANARLYLMDNPKSNHIGAWCASSLADKNSSWLQVDLGEQKSISFIATQGRDKHYERIKEFVILHSKDGRNFEQYQEKGQVRIFNGNCDHFTPVLNKFTQPLITRFIRVHPRKSNVPCLRMELYGC